MKELAVIIIQDCEVDEEEVHEAEIAIGQATPLANNVEISLHSIAGLSCPKAMKLEGELYGHKVVILIDSGASHNILSSSLVLELKLPLTPTNEYCVVLGTGEAVKGGGICKGVHISVQGIKII
jgi:hypothetical protein